MGAVAEDVRRVATLANPGDTLSLNQPGTAVVVINFVVTPNVICVFEATVDEGASPTWVGVPGVNVNNGQTVSLMASTGMVKVDMAGYRTLRVRLTDSDGGFAVVTMNGSVAPSSTDLVISKVGVMPQPVTTTDAGGNVAAAATDFESANSRRLLELILLELTLIRQTQYEQIGLATAGSNVMVNSLL